MAGAMATPFAIRQFPSPATRILPSWKLWLRHFHQLIAIMLLRWKATTLCGSNIATLATGNLQQHTAQTKCNEWSSLCCYCSAVEWKMSLHLSKSLLRFHIDK